MRVKIKVECGHKDRLHFAKGMCRQCYDHKRLISRNRSTCHPDLPEHVIGSGECQNCSWKRTGYTKSNLYNLTTERYNSMLSEQDNCCALCKLPFGDDKPQVDHDHKCCSGRKSCGNCIRGLIHSNCNVALGLFNDDVSILQLAIDYLNQGGLK